MQQAPSFHRAGGEATDDEALGDEQQDDGGDGREQRGRRHVGKVDGVLLREFTDCDRHRRGLALSHPSAAGPPSRRSRQ